MDAQHQSLVRVSCHSIVNDNAFWKATVTPKHCNYNNYNHNNYYYNYNNNYNYTTAIATVTNKSLTSLASDSAFW